MTSWLIKISNSEQQCLSVGFYRFLHRNMSSFRVLNICSSLDPSIHSLRIVWIALLLLRRSYKNNKSLHLNVKCAAHNAGARSLCRMTDRSRREQEGGASCQSEHAVPWSVRFFFHPRSVQQAFKLRPHLAIRDSWFTNHPAFNTPRIHRTRNGPTEPVTHRRQRSREYLQPHLIRVMTLEAIRYRSGSLQILNQLLLPHETVYEEIRSVQDGYEAIKSMKVRQARSTDPLPRFRSRTSEHLAAQRRVEVPLCRIRARGRALFVRVHVCVCSCKICITCAWHKVTLIRTNIFLE